jgi:hypothetical protein
MASDVVPAALDPDDRRIEVKPTPSFSSWRRTTSDRPYLPAAGSVRHVHDGDACAEAAEGLRHFAPDRPAADDQQAGHLLAQIEERFIRQVGHVAEAGDGRQARARTGGDHEGARGQLAAAHFEAVGGDEFAIAENDIDAQPPEALGAVGGRDVRDDRRDPFHHMGDIGLRRVRRNVVIGGGAHQVRDPGGLQQRLARDAAIVQAIAAHLVLFHQGDFRAQRRAARGNLSRQRAADDTMSNSALATLASRHAQRWAYGPVWSLFGRPILQLTQHSAPVRRGLECPGTRPIIRPGAPAEPSGTRQVMTTLEGFLPINNYVEKS